MKPRTCTSTSAMLKNSKMALRYLSPTRCGKYTGMYRLDSFKPRQH